MEAEEMKSPFEAIKQTDEAGHEWWNSRQLAKAMGYTKYWNFERLMDKVALALQVERGLNRNEHFPCLTDLECPTPLQPSAHLALHIPRQYQAT